ncbi:hypothetical protein GCM10010252_20880 [Streptomyces aureoverticillatus]|nr:hypothetical protein GCM10010252_20880 [Streptomyces aureoverticillatus]
MCIAEDAKDLTEAFAETGGRWGEVTALQPRDLRRRNGRPAIRIQVPLSAIQGRLGHESITTSVDRADWLLPGPGPGSRRGLRLLCARQSRRAAITPTFCYRSRGLARRAAT